MLTHKFRRRTGIPRGKKIKSVSTKDLRVPGVTLGWLSTLAVRGLGGPLGFPFNLLCRSVNESLLALWRKQLEDLWSHELGMLGVGDGNQAVGSNIVHITVRARDAHIRIWRGFIDDVLDHVVVVEMGGNRGESCGRSLGGCFASGGLVQFLGFVGGVIFITGRRASVGEVQ